jgi:NAD(P)H-hydrate epimerase
MTRLTRNQVRHIDRLASEQYHIPSIVLMENAARAVADVAWQMISATKKPSILILCGGGNNGGDGLAAARWLHNRGAQVHVWPQIDPVKYTGDALIQWQIVDAMRIEIVRPSRELDALLESGCDLIIDAVFGTGLQQAPRPPFDRLVETIASQSAPVLAVDLPSGLDCDTGEPLGPCIQATQTVTLVAEKIGFANPKAAAFLGRVTVGDIGCPPELVQQVLHAG